MLHKTTQVRACREGEPVLAKWLTNLALKATTALLQGKSRLPSNILLPRCPTQDLARLIFLTQPQGGTGILDPLE